MIKGQWLIISIGALSCIALASWSFSAERTGGVQKRKSDRQAAVFKVDVPAHPYDLILGRPENHSVTLSVLSYQDKEGQVVYGMQSGQYTAKTAAQTFRAGEPVHLNLQGLQANTRYYYQWRYRDAGVGEYSASPEYSFMTARLAGSSFVFTIQADSHLDNGTRESVYEQSLATVLAAKPDFHIDLGDTFMTDKYPNYSDAAPQYLAQRYYFGLIGHSVPVFLVLGNHDGERVDRGGRENAMAVWSNSMRKRYFANPQPDHFYSGSQETHPKIGKLENYYAWQWGDALFVALDPFWYTERTVRDSNGWPRTLGKTQYDWLKTTLENSHAKYKFVFIHHLVGGNSKESRGGAEAASFFEWGGKNLDGSDAFAENRPGWPMPIHQLLLKNKVSAVFHGHDHLYVKQDLDGMVYQEVPQPGHGHPSINTAAGYGYHSGVLLAGSGVMKVSITSENARIEYLQMDNTGGSKVAHAYTIAPVK